jgi:hypothetical protein
VIAFVLIRWSCRDAHPSPLRRHAAAALAYGEPKPATRGSNGDALALVVPSLIVPQEKNYVRTSRTAVRT